MYLILLKRTYSTSYYLLTQLTHYKLASKAKIVSPIKISVQHFCLFVWIFFKQNFMDTQGDWVAIATTPKFKT